MREGSPCFAEVAHLAETNLCVGSTTTAHDLHPSVGLAAPPANRDCELPTGAGERSPIRAGRVPRCGDWDASG